MFLTFLRHGGVAALVAGVVVELLAFLLGEIAVKPLMILLGALTFYFSEYGMHRFAFHAPPLTWPRLRKLQHRLHYEWVHYVAHIPYQPRTQLGRWIKQYHLRHHFISEKHWFGVSNPTLDRLFGTFTDPADVEKSGTTRKLYQ